MIDYHLDPVTAVLTLRPDSALQKSDFAELGKAVDPQIEAHGDLNGLIIEAPHFPGWDSFGALVTHMRFVRDHQNHVKKVAVVTDSHMGDVAEHLASHFIAADIRHFPAGDIDEARQWIADSHWGRRQGRGQVSGSPCPPSATSTAPVTKDADS